MTTKLEKLCIKWLNDNYGDLERYETEKYPDYIFHMKDGKCALEYNIKNGCVYVSYGEIWSFLERMFDMNYRQTQDLTKVWVEEFYKKEVTITNVTLFGSMGAVEEFYKKQVTTTCEAPYENDEVVGECYKKEVTTTEGKANNNPVLVEEQYEKEVKTTYSSPIEDLSMVEENYKIK